jgi:hypothetical protein
LKKNNKKQTNKQTKAGKKILKEKKKHFPRVVSQLLPGNL